MKQKKLDLVVNYLLRLINAGMHSFSKADVISGLNSIGFKDSENVISVMIKNKTLIPLKNGKITFNLVELRKNKQ